MTRVLGIGTVSPSAPPALEMCSLRRYGISEKFLGILIVRYSPAAVAIAETEASHTTGGAGEYREDITAIHVSEPVRAEDIGKDIISTTNHDTFGP